ncbi:MAG TPA: phosphomannomutase/phosphoglucomutase [Frankiaceae bacterium]|nr:phosphomannomutase/phosphoglucomutase [Frankiaceae bacterium]
MPDVSAIVKAYDVRGTVPDQLNPEVARLFGAAFADLVGGPAVVIAYDMRPSSPDLADAFAEGVTSQGVDAVIAGLGSTDLLYFASGKLGLPGAMFTASHNPAQYNGIKLCLAGAAPVGQDTGLGTLRDAVNAGGPAPKDTRGSVTRQELLAEYAAHMHALVDVSGSRPLKVVVDAGNGMGGLTVPAVFEGLPLDVTPLYFELDGTFPNHEANPIEPANLVDLQKAVLENAADIGLAFDGDADRCFVVDERGQVVSPSAITALVAARELRRAPGSAVIHNLICSRSVPEVIRENGGTPVRTRVGHSFIKAEMAATNAVFGGEHSGHFYFRDFWRADSGMLAALHVLASLGAQDGPLSALLAAYDRYAASGEINTRVADARATMAAVEAAYAGRDGVEVDHLDGLTVSAAAWWFNLRPSNTEPLLRLNAEAVDTTTMVQLRDEVLALVRGPEGASA